MGGKGALWKKPVNMKMQQCRLVGLFPLQVPQGNLKCTVCGGHASSCLTLRIVSVNSFTCCRGQSSLVSFGPKWFHMFELSHFSRLLETHFRRHEMKM